MVRRRLVVGDKVTSGRMKEMDERRGREGDEWVLITGWDECTRRRQEGSEAT